MATVNQLARRLFRSPAMRHSKAQPALQLLRVWRERMRLRADSAEWFERERQLLRQPCAAPTQQQQEAEEHLRHARDELKAKVLKRFGETGELNHEDYKHYSAQVDYWNNRLKVLAKS